MSAIILDGKKLSKISEDLIKEKVEKLSFKISLQPSQLFWLAMIQHQKLMSK